MAVPAQARTPRRWVGGKLENRNSEKPQTTMSIAARIGPHSSSKAPAPSVPGVLAFLTPAADAVAKVNHLVDSQRERDIGCWGGDDVERHAEQTNSAEEHERG